MDHAAASWSAAVFCRYQWLGDIPKAGDILRQ